MTRCNTLGYVQIEALVDKLGETLGKATAATLKKILRNTKAKWATNWSM